MHNDPEVEKKQGWITVGDLEGCVHYKVGKNLSILLSGYTCVCLCMWLCGKLKSSDNI